MQASDQSTYLKGKFQLIKTDLKPYLNTTVTTSLHYMQLLNVRQDIANQFTESRDIIIYNIESW